MRLLPVLSSAIATTFVILMLQPAGAAERVEKRMSLALTFTGYLIGIPIFCDAGYVILNPLVHSAAIRTGLNMSTMATGLIGAMLLVAGTGGRIVEVEAYHYPLAEQHPEAQHV